MLRGRCVLRAVLLVLASISFTQLANTALAQQQTQNYTINAPSSVDAGTAFTITWTAPVSRPNLSWIGVYEEGVNDRDPVTWDRIPDTNESGTYTVTVGTPGDYDVRLFAGASYDEVANDSFVATLDLTKYTWNVFPMSLARGEQVTVAWNVPPSSTTNDGWFREYNNDWVGVFPTGANDTEPYEWERVDDPTDSTTFTMNVSGVYEIRYFKGATYNRLYTSEAITVRGDTGNGVCNGIDLSTITNYPSGGGPIVAVGDSLTAGIGASPNEDYVGELEDRLGINIVNAAISGDTTQEVLARLEEDVLSMEPSTVIVFVGGNDELRRLYEDVRDIATEKELLEELNEATEDVSYNWQGVPLLTRDESFENLNTIVQRIHETGATVLLVGIDFGVLSPTVTDRYRDVANTNNTVYVPDIYAGVIGRPSLMTDLIHPNDAGYDFFASRIAPRLDCLIANP